MSNSSAAGEPSVRETHPTSLAVSHAALANGAKPAKQFLKIVRSIGFTKWCSMRAREFATITHNPARRRLRIYQETLVQKEVVMRERRQPLVQLDRRPQ
ncbi:MAG TPA: hypothetical protein VGP12_08410 [Nitrosospira sp.]|nr:hypothetical protein [Nitrosospira sp.]